MSAFSDLGRLLIITGIVLVLAGVLLSAVGAIPFVGKLPGDIFIRRGHGTFFFPLATSLLLSLLLTIVFSLLFRR